MAAGDLHEYQYTEPCGGVFFPIIPIYADWVSISLQVDYGGPTMAYVALEGQTVLSQAELSEGDSWADETYLNNLSVSGALVGLDPVNANISNIVLTLREAAGAATDWTGIFGMMGGMVVMMALLGVMVPKLAGAVSEGE